MNNTAAFTSVPGCARGFSGFLALAGALLLISAGISATAALPVPPQAILDALPDAPDGWELTTSRGRASIASEGGYSQAERTYAAGEAVRAKAALLAAEADVVPGPLEVRTQVTDTIHNGIAKIQFAAWKETGGTATTGKTQFLRLGGQKAIVTQSEGGRLKVVALINDRFVVTSEFSPSATVEHAVPWLAGIDAKGLARYRHAVDMKVKGKEEINLTTDEMNPFKRRVIAVRGGKLEEVASNTRSYRSAPADLTLVERQIDELIASGDLPKPPTEEELEAWDAEAGAMIRAFEEAGGAEAEVEKLQELGLLPAAQQQPATTPKKETVDGSEGESAEESEEEPEQNQ